MAYPVVAETGHSEASSSYSQAIPSGHQSGDLLLAIIYQDGGGTTFAGLASGWALVSSPSQAQQNSQRTHVAWKAAASSSEADFTVTGASDEWVVSIIVIRGADTTTPFQATPVRKSLTDATSHTSDAITTTDDNCLIIYAAGVDGPGVRLAPSNPGDWVYLAKSAGNNNGCMLVGYRNQISAGTTATVAVQVNRTDGGTFWTLAIADDGNGHMGPDSRTTYEVIRYHGEFAGAQDTGITWSALTSISGLTSATIDGIGVDTTAPTTAAAITTTLGNEWNNNESTSVEALSNLLFTVNLGAGDKWVGGAYLLPASLDMSDRLFFCRVALNSWSSPSGSKGLIVVFEDTGGDWAAFRITTNVGVPGLANSSEAVVIDHENWTPLASSGTMDWTAIRRIGFGIHRVAGLASSRIFAPKDTFLLPRAVLVGGSEPAPVNVTNLERMLQGWSDEPIFTQQGSGQGMPRAAVQFGDGSVQTYVDTTASSFEFPRPYDASYRRRFWQVEEGTLDLRIKASATDTIRMAASVAATATSQRFIIDPASSASASYDFAGLALVGWVVENSVSGITLNGVTFSACRGITLDGGAMADCAIGGSVVTPAVTTTDPGEISNCAFTQGNAGHAIEITTPGTYTFTGNTFTGYGTDGSTDAAIYNNSGGAVTLNIDGGGGTPTVRNGVSASTTVVSGATLTLTGLKAGSDVVVLDAGTTTERVNVDANAGTTYAYAYTASGDVDIGVFKVGYKPFYIRGYTLSGADASLPIQQVADPAYSNP